MGTTVVVEDKPAIAEVAGQRLDPVAHPVEHAGHALHLGPAHCPQWVHTVRGVGYRLARDAEPA